MKLRYIKFAFVGLATVMALGNCTEHIEEGARFTFKGNTIATYLQDTIHEGRFSHFVEILTRGECIGLMKAYGTYTCFAPTNEAIERFLIEQDSIYWASVKAHEENSANKIVNTGITSPKIEDLTAEKCAEISRNHIIGTLIRGVDLTGNSIPNANMNERTLMLGTDSLTGRYSVDKTAPILDEEEVENGIVHIVDGVINPSTQTIAVFLDQYEYFSIFSEALRATGYDVLLTETEDQSYVDGERIEQDWYGRRAPCPVKRRYGFTLFIEPNKVYEQNGIKNLEDLVEKCNEWFGPGTKVWIPNNDKNQPWTQFAIDHSILDTLSYKDPRHPLNQFVGYHILNTRAPYERMVCYKISIKGVAEFDSEKDFPGDSERTEYYVSMNNRILKATIPLGKDKDENRYLNYAAEDKGQNILVYAPNEFVTMDNAYAEYKQEALNGTLNVIDELLLYDETIMKEHVLNGIMRIDIGSLCPELANNDLRWQYRENTTNPENAVFIPHDYIDRMQVFSENTRLFYTGPIHYGTGWRDFQGDEFIALGLFDIAYLLPPVPENTYEIRLGYTHTAERGIAQIYLDNEVTGIPLDLTIHPTSDKIGWKPDNGDDKNSLQGDEDLIAANDKEMKNRGYLKGPSTFFGMQELARDNNGVVRVVVATKYLTEGAHWLRFKNMDVKNPDKAQFMHDYIEIVPTSYLRREDISLAEKRK